MCFLGFVWLSVRLILVFVEFVVIFCFVFCVLMPGGCFCGSVFDMCGGV